MSRVQRNGRIVAFATQGSDSGDAERLRTLLSQLDTWFYPFERSSRVKEFFRLVCYFRKNRPRLVVMEGTGLAGGAALILARIVWGIRYVVSSGDAVGPFVRRSHPMLGILFSAYERVLCRLAAGFIGWTPYLTGRALTFGCPRGMTAPGWASVQKTPEELQHSRAAIRQNLGITEDAIVIGLAGSLKWNARVGFCYGYELVRAIKRVQRKDVIVLIVGDGDGKTQLEQLAGDDVGTRVFFTGRVPRDEVMDYLSSMDVASLPQSLDGVGNFRYTTKVSEYVAAGLPIVTGHLPMTYDLPSEWFWKLNGDTPWGKVYICSLIRLLDRITKADIAWKGAAISRMPSAFRKDAQIASVILFLSDLAAESDQVSRNTDQEAMLQ